MPRCRSGSGCAAERAPERRFCPEHAEQLDRVAAEINSRKRNIKAVKPKPPETHPKPPPPPSEPAKLPIEVRLRRLTEFVAKQDGRPVTRAIAARACGYASVQGGISRVIKRAVAEGLIEVRRGPRGGLIPGPKLAAATALAPNQGP